MKKSLLVGCILWFAFASAQNTTDTFWIKPPALPKKHLPGTPQTFTLIDQSKLLHTLPNGNKVYALPQDNMPCVVPDTSQYSMPVINPGLQPYRIPNPAYPPQDGIKPLSPDKLKELQDYFNKKSKKPGK